VIDHPIRETTMVKAILALVATAEAATLAVTWGDCGAKHAIVDGLSPTSIKTGGSGTTLIGTGISDEDVTSATFTATVKAKGVKIASCSGDATSDIVCKLPAGVGTITVKAVSFPLEAGRVNIPVAVKVSSLIPASLATTDTHIEAVDQNGDSVICLDVSTKKAAEMEDEIEVEKSCSGSTDPEFTEARCYHGSAGALGLTETVDVKLVDFASSAGHINVAGDGIAGFTCDNHDFSKSGQAINTDLSDCQPDGISISKVLYCSDQDSIKVTVKADAVPIPISTQLSRVDCASRQAGASCSGSADPDVSSPRCYHGKGGALGLTENVDIKISDFSGGAGHIDVAGDGIEGFTCSNHGFTKSGQAITTDLSDCQPDGIAISKVLYCSDQDTVKVTVKDQTVPIPVTATLKKVDCASAVVV